MRILFEEDVSMAAGEVGKYQVAPWRVHVSDGSKAMIKAAAVSGTAKVLRLGDHWFDQVRPGDYLEVASQDTFEPFLIGVVRKVILARLKELRIEELRPTGALEILGLDADTLRRVLCQDFGIPISGDDLLTVISVRVESMA